MPPETVSEDHPASQPTPPSTSAAGTVDINLVAEYLLDQIKRLTLENAMLTAQVRQLLTEFSQQHYQA